MSPEYEARAAADRAMQELAVIRNAWLDELDEALEAACAVTP